MASEADDTTDHGYRVLSTLTCIAPDAVYNLYRTVAPNGTFRPSNYLKALDAARSHRVALLNSSAGIHHSDCGGTCRICEATRTVASEGICVIAGAGNAVDERRGVYCPARLPEVVSVGVYESLCAFDFDSGRQSPLDPSGEIYPPGSFRLPAPVDDDGAWVPDKPYCGGLRCAAGATCADHRVEQRWDGNPHESAGSIDVFAPGTVAPMTESGPVIEIGTSFSTALVTGVLADHFGELHGSGPVPRPGDVRDAISRLGSTVGSSNSPKLASDELFDALSK